MVISSFMGQDYQASSDNTPRSNPLTLPFSLAAEAAHKTHEETQVPLVWASGPATVASSGNAKREPTLPPTACHALCKALSATGASGPRKKPGLELRGSFHWETEA